MSDSSEPSPTYGSPESQESSLPTSQVLAGELTRPVKTVLLVGTRHDYQRPGSQGSEEFHALVAATCQEQDIKGIAEEMSLDALSLYGAKQSVCKQVADSFRIPHCYCDPSIEEQKKLGIDQPGKIGLSGFSAIRGPHEVDPEERASSAIRERCWLEHMLKLDSWPVLFVCGAHHTESFRVLLQANDIIVHVLVPNWAPN